MASDSSALLLRTADDWALLIDLTLLLFFFLLFLSFSSTDSLVFRPFEPEFLLASLVSIWTDTIHPWLFTVPMAFQVYCWVCDFCHGFFESLHRWLFRRMSGY